MESKQELRKRMKEVRNAVSMEKRQCFSKQISQNLLRETWYSSVKHILVYSAIQSEADLTEFCEIAAKDGKLLYYPKVFGKEMEFFRIERKEMLCPGAFSVMEPDTESFPLESYQDRENSVILVPGVAFSREGFRLGYGGGFYDRYLAMHPVLYKIGIGFSVQMSEKWIPEKYDIPMNEIVTDIPQEEKTWK